MILKFEESRACLKPISEKILDPNENQLSIPKMSKDAPCTCTNTYDCKCENCKLGNLPVLLEGIEARLQDQASTSSSSSSTKPTKKGSMSCTDCDKHFNHKGDLKKHLRTHSGEKPFKCKDCKMEFSHASNLKRHSKTHSGEKPYKCNSCGKRFSRSDKLAVHKKNRKCRLKDEK